jgi:aldose 1-epimerase
MEKILLQNDTWSLELWPDFGMNPVSLRYRGEPVLREPSCMMDVCRTPLLYGIPVLFPANRTKDAKFTFDGKDYTLPLNEPDRFNNLHGCLYATPFTVLEQNGNTVKSCLKNTKQCFPFPFTMTFTDTLTEEGYRRVIELHNDSETPMPVTISFHSTFTAPETFTVKVGERFEFDRYYIPTWKMG